MQPYFFPYIGYFQLIAAVDKFIIYDDVNYINRGWVNRNNILVNQGPHLIQIPLAGASQNRLINEIGIVTESKWKLKILKTIHLNYVKAPFFESVFFLFETIINSNNNNISSLNVFAIKSICNFMGIQTHIVNSSTIYNNEHLKAQKRILDICIKEDATHYINPIGGVTLYDKDYFRSYNIELNFIQTNNASYKQHGNITFVPNLSILDVLMNVDRKELRALLNNYNLI